MDALEAIEGRRSLRHFAARAVPRELLERCIRLACAAPAPHHTRPWRLVEVVSPEAKARLAEEMGRAWRHDLQHDGVDAAIIAALLERSERQMMGAPALVLLCLAAEGLRRWPDQRRREAEWQMAVQSGGAALQNLMLAAHALGLASFWISAPLFCAEAVLEALRLPEELSPQALVALGYPAPGAAPGERPPADLSLHRLER